MDVEARREREHGGCITYRDQGGYRRISLYSYVSVLEADIVADLAGGSSAGLGQEEPPVGTNANLVDSLPVARGRGAGCSAGVRATEYFRPTTPLSLATSSNYPRLFLTACGRGGQSRSAL
ncbi:hypothetical protein EYF80_025130 [Liparis tanakae]|uniref:Uncharacterized protein n=1 Tax=Liparis tanakae TaxID=230148 RepID=A0A4Z2HG90_9TELE|nr:hypothetical protein EYF80_025130 [Liparis tanakae]